MDSDAGHEDGRGVDRGSGDGESEKVPAKSDDSKDTKGFLVTLVTAAGDTTND